MQICVQNIKHSVYRKLLKVILNVYQSNIYSLVFSITVIIQNISFMGNGIFQKSRFSHNFIYESALANNVGNVMYFNFTSFI